MCKVNFYTMLILLGGMFSSSKADPGVGEKHAASIRRGKQIYLQGESESGSPIYAMLGNPPMQVSAKMLPCVNCHGYEGRGIPEGGVTPSNISWSMLTKSYGLKHESGRRHKPYDEKTLLRAITKGLDPSGNTLGVGMPQFKMDDVDMASLMAYLKFIEHDRDPGITDSELHIATMLPLDGPFSSMGQDIADVLKARFSEINNAGGIYKRKINLHVIPAKETPQESISHLRAMLESKEIFALISPYIPGAEDALSALSNDLQIPIIAPLGKTPEAAKNTNRYIFYLSSGLPAQARALVDYCVEEFSGTQPVRIALMMRSGNPFDHLAELIKQQCGKHNINLQIIPPYREETYSPKSLARKLKNVDALFFLGSDIECKEILQYAANYHHVPHVYQIGAFLGYEVFDMPAEFQGKLSATFPNSSSSRTPQAVQEYRSFFSRHNMTAVRSPARLAAYCAGTVLIESLQRSGRALRREKLIKQLEGFYEFETGLIPPITFGPNRRVGAYGAYAVSIDLQSKSIVCSNHWIEPME